MSTDFTVTGATPQDLTLKLIESGLYLLGEGRPILAPGVIYSHISDTETSSVGFVSLDDSVSNIDEIKSKLGTAINMVGSPIRVICGEAVAAAVPTLNNVQIRLALEEMGMLDTVKEAVSASNEKTKIWWEESLIFKRDNQMVLDLAAALKVPDEVLDRLWELGATIDV